MNLEQFKKSFESDAYKRSEQQEKTIKELHARIKQLTEDLEFRKHQAQQMENRCYRLTLGIICRHCEFIFCAFKDALKGICQARATRAQEDEQ